MILYVSDLDGTLLNSSAKISSNSTKLLNEALNNNISFTIATARTPATIVPILKNINLNMPVIAMNGCSIYDLKNNKYIHTISINSNLISKLQKLISSEGLNPFIYTL
nr:HAD family hydrolase [Clostridium sp.]